MATSHSLKQKKKIKKHYALYFYCKLKLFITLERIRYIQKNGKMYGTPCKVVGLRVMKLNNISHNVVFKKSAKQIAY